MYIWYLNIIILFNLRFEKPFVKDSLDDSLKVAFLK